MPRAAPVNLPPARITALTMKEKASVVIARYKPLSRSDGTPTTSPATAGTTPAMPKASSGCQPSRLTAIA